MGSHGRKSFPGYGTDLWHPRHERMTFKLPHPFSRHRASRNSIPQLPDGGPTGTPVPLVERPIFSVTGATAPTALRASLDDRAVGQDKAKELLSQIFALHLWNFDREVDRRLLPNALLIGPRESGKTYSMQT